MAPGTTDPRENEGDSAHTPCCHLKAHILPWVRQWCPHTQPAHPLPRMRTQTPTGTGTDPSTLSLCQWHWPDPEESRGMLDAGGKGGEGWVAQLGRHPDKEK